MKRSSFETIPPAEKRKMTDIPTEIAESLHQLARTAAIEHGRSLKPSLVRRAGQMALKGVSRGAAKSSRAKQTVQGTSASIRHKLNRSVNLRAGIISPRLQTTHERLEAAPDKNPAKKLGHLMVKGSLKTSEAVARHTEKRTIKLDAKRAQIEDNLNNDRGGRIATRARNYISNLADRKKKAERAEKRTYTRAIRQAASEYRAEQAEAREQKRLNYLSELQSRRWGHLDLARDWVATNFRDQEIGSLSKFIPRRSHYDDESGFVKQPEPFMFSAFDGDYSDLARDTLDDALQYRTDKGKIPLLGGDYQKMRLQAMQYEAPSMAEVEQRETSYVGGVGTLLWQLGFVEFDSEEDIPRGHGKLNPDVVWSQDIKNKAAIQARIPADPANELHQMLASPGESLAGRYIELQMPMEIPRYEERLVGGKHEWHRAEVQGIPQNLPREPGYSYLNLQLV